MLEGVGVVVAMGRRLPPRLLSGILALRDGEAGRWSPSETSDLGLTLVRQTLKDDDILVVLRPADPAPRGLLDRAETLPPLATDQVIAGITQDLRGPLASIVFSASVLGRTCRELSYEELEEGLEQISEAARDVQAIVARLLVYFRPGSS